MVIDKIAVHNVRAEIAAKVAVDAKNKQNTVDVDYDEGIDNRKVLRTLME